MKSLTLLVDMDDVLENLVECWVQALNEQYGTSVCEKDITSWHIAEFFPTLTKAQVFGILQDSDFWERLSPLPKAPEKLERLISDGHTVRIVTASHYMAVAPKIKLLLRIYPYLTWEDVIIASDKRLIKGDVMIDDGIHNLETTTCEKLLFDRPHNHNYCAEKNRMTRVHNWDEVYYEVTKIAGGME